MADPLLPSEEIKARPKKPALGDALTDYVGQIGPAWAASNAAFQATNPSVTDELLRGVNPLTGIGSAIGAMHDAAGHGDNVGMGVAAASALPIFGAVTGAAKGVAGPVLRHGLRRPAVQAGQQFVSSLYDKIKGY